MNEPLNTDSPIKGHAGEGQELLGGEGSQRKSRRKWFTAVGAELGGRKHEDEGLGGQRPSFRGPRTPTQG